MTVSVAVGRALLHCFGGHLQPCLQRQWRHPRWPCLVALQARHTLIEIPLLPSPDRGLRRICAAHDLEGAMAVGRRNNDLGPPDKPLRRVAVRDQGLKLCAVRGGKVKAYVRTPPAQGMTRPAAVVNLVSGGEH